jgi:beta-carotene hydroxylase
MSSDPSALSERDSRKEELREENAIVAPYRGAIAWRLIIEFAFTWAAFAAAFVLAATGRISLWAAFPVCVVSSSMIYMPLHESVHRNVAGDNKNMQWLNELVGRMSGIIFVFGLKQHRKAHLLHHAHTNEVGGDPDVITAGDPRRIPGTVALITVMSLLTPVLAFIPPSRKLIPKSVGKRLGLGVASKMDPEDQKNRAIRNFIDIAVLIGFTVAGLGPEIWLLWYAATRIAFTWVVFIFGWYPHHPHAETGRYRDTRIATFPGSTFLIRGHDYHLLHHLYPRVVHYKLPVLWNDIEDVMIARGARIEGTASRVGAPIIWGSAQ